MFLKKIFRVDAEFEFLPNTDASIEGVRIKDGFFSWNSFKNPYVQAQCGPHSENKADRHKSRAPRKHRPMDGRMDGRTDRMAYRVACTRLKTSISMSLQNQS